MAGPLAWSCLRRSRSSVARPRLAQRAWRLTGAQTKATDIAFVGEFRGKRGSAGRTIRLIRLFEVSTLLFFMRRLIFPYVLFAWMLSWPHSFWRHGVPCGEELRGPHEASRNQCQVKVRWSQQWSWLACLFVRFSLVSLPVGCYLVFKSHWSHSFCRRPAGHAA